MIECQVCGAPSQLFLCRADLNELRDMLYGLAQGKRHTNGRHSPGWLELLGDAAVGHTRLGNTGASSGRREPFKGDDEVLPKCQCQHAEHEGRECEAADLCGCVEYRPVADQAALRRQFLAAGGVNARASTLLRKVRRLVGEWLDVAATATGVRYNSLDPSDLAGPVMWLSHNAKGVANTEQAGLILGQVKQVVDDIERAINLPQPPRPCGPCPTTLPGRRQCGRELAAPRDATEVVCPVCKESYNVEELIARLLNQTHYLTFTVRELCRLLPLGQENVPRSTLYDWIGRGWLQSRGTDIEGTPKYLMADVRRLRSEQPKRKVRA